MLKPLYDIFCRVVLHRPRLRLFLTSMLVPNEATEATLFGARLCFHKQKEIGYLRAVSATSQSAVLRDEIGSLINLSSILRPGDTFLDIGANVGLYSSVLVRFSNVLPGLRFYAFEANPDTVQRLKKTLADKAVQIYSIAISDHEGSMTFCEGTTSGVFAPVEHLTQFNTDVKHAVECQRLDEIHIEGNSLVLKIDVEGHEAAVLKGAAKLFEAQRIKAILLDGYLDPEIPFELESRGFKLFNGLSFEPLTASSPSRNLLAINCRWLSDQANFSTGK